MISRDRFLSAAALGVGLTVFCAAVAAQQTSPAPTPSDAQKALQRQAADDGDKRHRLQSQAKQILDAEKAAEGAKACPNAKTTIDFKECFETQVAIADHDLTTFEGIIRELQAPDAPNDGTAAPATETAPAAETAPPTETAPGETMTPQQYLAEFNRVEASWLQYRKMACTAAFHQLYGGTGAPSFELECHLKLDRSHMRELDMIYGVDLHL